MIAFKVLLAWLLADFIAGVVHWAQDKLLDVETAFDFLNTFKEDNDLHHAKPAAMLKLSAWENMRGSALFAWPLSFALYFTNAPTVLWLGVFFSAFGNAIHRFAHVPNPRWLIRGLQEIGFFCSFEHHMPHHVDANGLVTKENSTRRYCVMSAWLNPLLDGVGFWRGLNWIARVK